MAARKKEKFATLSTPYPKHAYIVLLFITAEEEVKTIVPLTYIHLSKNEAILAIKDVVDNIKQSHEIEIPEYSILIPITLQELYPLKKEYWDNPSTHYDPADRLNLFMRAAENPQLYKLLVTPSLYDKDGRWYMSATLPLPLTSDHKSIEQFMMTSDQPVDQRATDAAIYHMEEAIRLNWKTGEILPKETVIIGKQHTH